MCTGIKVNNLLGAVILGRFLPEIPPVLMRKSQEIFPEVYAKKLEKAPVLKYVKCTLNTSGVLFKEKSVSEPYLSWKQRPITQFKPPLAIQFFLRKKKQMLKSKYKGPNALAEHLYTGA